jgi:hypothetical protein
MCRPFGLRVLLVLPVRGDALLGDAVHLVRANLDLEGLPDLRHHGGVQRLVHVRLRDGDEVLDAAGHRPPDRVHDPERAVAILHRIRQDPEGHVVVDLVDIDALAPDLAVDG